MCLTEGQQRYLGAWGTVLEEDRSVKEGSVTRQASLLSLSHAWGAENQGLGSTKKCFPRYISSSFPDSRAQIGPAPRGVLFALPEANGILSPAWLRTKRAAGNNPYMWVLLLLALS